MLFRSTFQTAVGYPDEFGGVGGLTFADLNGDGKLDVIVTHGGTSVVSYLLGNGDGTLQNFVDVSVAAVGVVATGDFNGDGKLDFAVCTDAQFVPSTVSLFLQQ